MLEKGSQYENPQTAWEAWDIGSEMLWMLYRAGADNSKVILCGCEMLSRILPSFEAKYPHCSAPSEALELATQCAAVPYGSERYKELNTLWENVREDYHRIYDSEDAAKQTLMCFEAVRLVSAAGHIAYYAADKAAILITQVFGCIAFDMTPNDSNDDYHPAGRKAYEEAKIAEQKRQADIVRTWFPICPFLDKEAKEKTT